jgi:hypothetical protein
MQSTKPMPDLTHILAWYTGKAQDVIRDFVLPTLAAAEAEGCWPPKTSRTVHATLNKQAVATRFARAHARREHRDGDVGLLGDVMEVRGSLHFKSRFRSWDLLHAMQFGNVLWAPQARELANQLAPYCASDAEREALVTARRWATDFVPVAEILARLDAARPKPTFAFKEISRGVLENVGRSMGLTFETVRAPEIKWHRKESMDSQGKIQLVIWGEILWPAGTRHNTSKFSAGSNQCHACGHGIRDPFNWVPLVMDSARGDSPASLWVGRDCARHLFGCVVTGEGVELRREPVPG